MDKTTNPFFCKRKEERNGSRILQRISPPLSLLLNYFPVGGKIIHSPNRNLGFPSSSLFFKSSSPFLYFVVKLTKDRFERQENSGTSFDTWILKISNNNNNNFSIIIICNYRFHKFTDSRNSRISAKKIQKTTRKESPPSKQNPLSVPSSLPFSPRDGKDSKLQT